MKNLLYSLALALIAGLFLWLLNQTVFTVPAAKGVAIASLFVVAALYAVVITVRNKEKGNKNKEPVNPGTRFVILLALEVVWLAFMSITVLIGFFLLRILSPHMSDATKILDSTIFAFLWAFVIFGFYVKNTNEDGVLKK